jgi:hypothetical protein
MKNAIFAGVSASVLLLAGSALAAGNNASIDQIGFTQTATVDQTTSSSDAVATVHQSDAYNLANVTQGASGNHADVTQSQGSYGAVRNPSNISNSNQQGTNSALTVVQVGNSTAGITQYGSSNGEDALIGQNGNGNTANIGQQGTSELAVIVQTHASNNQASISQSGTGNGDFSAKPYLPRPTGPGNLVWSENTDSSSGLPGSGSGLTRYGPVGAVVDQDGSSDIGNISQAGLDNFADVSQDSGSNNTGTISQGSGNYYSDGLIYQHGSFNVASISQVGAGSAYSTVWQNGTSNQAYSSQNGANHSAIEQGFNSDANDLAGSVDHEYASVSQGGGGGNTSEVRQLGSNDTANVTQFGANASASIVQHAGGSFNTATIHQ